MIIRRIFSWVLVFHSRLLGTNCFSLILKHCQVILRNSVFSAELDCIEFLLANPIPYRNDFYLVSLCNFVTSVHFRQKYPSFLYGFYTCVYLGLVIY
nr:MAG TPA: hypothetical protein [Caudoviricetes sp.]